MQVGSITGQVAGGLAAGVGSKIQRAYTDTCIISFKTLIHSMTQLNDHDWDHRGERLIGISMPVVWEMAEDIRGKIGPAKNQNARQQAVSGVLARLCGRERQNYAVFLQRFHEKLVRDKETKKITYDDKFKEEFMNVCDSSVAKFNALQEAYGRTTRPKETGRRLSMSMASEKETKLKKFKNTVLVEYFFYELAKRESKHMGSLYNQIIPAFKEMDAAHEVIAQFDFKIKLEKLKVLDKFLV